MNTHLDIGAWNFLYVVNLFSILFIFHFLYGKLHRDTKRIIIGLSFIFAGISLRIGGWLPWRSFLYTSNNEWAVWYREQSWLWTGGGALLFILGITIFVWPWLVLKFNKMALPVAVSFQVVVYTTGYHLTKYFGGTIINLWSM